MSTVFVTGVNGFIGSRLAASLAGRGHVVAGSTARESGLDVATPGVGRKMVLTLGAGCDASLLQGTDVLIHCAWDSRPGTTGANVHGTRQVVEAAGRAGVSYQLFVSSYSAHPLALTDYGRAKYIVQQDCLRRGLAVVRPGLVVGAGGLFRRMSDTVRRHRAVPLIDGGRSTVPIVALADLERAITDIVERRLTGVFNLFHPDLVTLGALLREIRAATGRRTLLISMPSAVLLTLLWVMVRIGMTPPITDENVRAVRVNAQVQARSDLVAFVPHPLGLVEMVRASTPATGGGA